MSRYFVTLAAPGRDIVAIVLVKVVAGERVSAADTRSYGVAVTQGAWMRMTYISTVAWRRGFSGCSLESRHGCLLDFPEMPWNC